MERTSLPRWTKLTERGSGSPTEEFSDSGVDIRKMILILERGHARRTNDPV